MTRPTVHRWLKDEPQFCDRVEVGPTEMIDAATGVLAASTAAFADTLEALAVDPNVAPQFRIAAASRGLELAVKYRDAGAFEERLRQLEIACWPDRAGARELDKVVASIPDEWLTCLAPMNWNASPDSLMKAN